MHQIRYDVHVILDLFVTPAEYLPVLNTWDISCTVIIVMSISLVWEVFVTFVAYRYMVNTLAFAVTIPTTTRQQIFSCKSLIRPSYI